MIELGQLVRDYGFQTVFSLVALAAIVWIGKSVSVFLLKTANALSEFLLREWSAKDKRITELETRVEAINNGQRTAMEQRLDASTEAANRMVEALQRITTVIERCPGGSGVKTNNG